MTVRALTRVGFLVAAVALAVGLLVVTERRQEVTSSRGRYQWSVLRTFSRSQLPGVSADISGLSRYALDPVERWLWFAPLSHRSGSVFRLDLRDGAVTKVDLPASQEGSDPLGVVALATDATGRLYVVAVDGEEFNRVYLADARPPLGQVLLVYEGDGLRLVKRTWFTLPFEMPHSVDEISVAGNGFLRVTSLDMFAGQVRGLSCVSPDGEVIWSRRAVLGEEMTCPKDRASRPFALRGGLPAFTRSTKVIGTDGRGDTVCAVDFAIETSAARLTPLSDSSGVQVFSPKGVRVVNTLLPDDLMPKDGERQPLSVLVAESGKVYIPEDSRAEGIRVWVLSWER